MEIENFDRLDSKVCDRLILKKCDRWKLKIGDEKLSIGRIQSRTDKQVK